MSVRVFECSVGSAGKDGGPVLAGTGGRSGKDVPEGASSWRDAPACCMFLARFSTYWSLGKSTEEKERCGEIGIRSLPEIPRITVKKKRTLG